MSKLLEESQFSDVSDIDFLKEKLDNSYYCMKGDKYTVKEMIDTFSLAAESILKKDS